MFEPPISWNCARGTLCKKCGCASRIFLVDYLAKLDSKLLRKHCFWSTKILGKKCVSIEKDELTDFSFHKTLRLAKLSQISVLLHFELCEHPCKILIFKNWLACEDIQTFFIWGSIHRYGEGVPVYLTASLLPQPVTVAPGGDNIQRSTSSPPISPIALRSHHTPRPFFPPTPLPSPPPSASPNFLSTPAAPAPRGEVFMWRQFCWNTILQPCEEEPEQK